LAVGQPAIITLETWPDEEIAGEIVGIAPKPTVDNSAIVSYEVRLSLGETNLPVLIGMTAEADLITAAKEGVLLVPNQAITPDRAAGTYTVNLVETNADGGITTRTVEVTIGLKDDDYTEITSGLQEDDRLALNVITAATEEEPGGIFGMRSPRGNMPPR
jgi:multidrug efflux pump subunit AcrA (membrane-fusion protein)